jgi:hypothetical protein
MSAMGTLDTARVGFVLNITESNILEFDLQSTNEDNYTIQVNVIPKNLTNIENNQDYNFLLSITNSSYLLEPNNKVKSHIVLKINKLGKYEGDYLVEYSELNSSKKVGLNAHIQILVIEDEHKSSGITGGVIGTNSINKSFISIIIFFILGLIILTIIVSIRKKKIERQKIYGY